MSRGGKRNGAGRPRGSLTRKTAEIAHQAAERGLSPLEVMLKAMAAHCEAGRWDDAAEIARHAAPYCHPRLSAMQISGGESPVQLQMVEEVVLGVSANGDGEGVPNGQANP